MHNEFGQGAAFHVGGDMKVTKLGGVGSGSGVVDFTGIPRRIALQEGIDYETTQKREYITIESDELPSGTSFNIQTSLLGPTVDGHHITPAQPVNVWPISHMDHGWSGMIQAIPTTLEDIFELYVMTPVGDRVYINVHDIVPFATTDNFETFQIQGTATHYGSNYEVRITLGALVYPDNPDVGISIFSDTDGRPRSSLYMRQTSGSESLYLSYWPGVSMSGQNAKNVLPLHRIASIKLLNGEVFQNTDRINLRYSAKLTIEGHHVYGDVRGVHPDWVYHFPIELNGGASDSVATVTVGFQDPNVGGSARNTLFPIIITNDEIKIHFANLSFFMVWYFTGGGVPYEIEHTTHYVDIDRI